jgi:hypothetical protein
MRNIVQLTQHSTRVCAASVVSQSTLHRRSQLSPGSLGLSTVNTDALGGVRHGGAPEVFLLFVGPDFATHLVLSGSALVLGWRGERR